MKDLRSLVSALDAPELPPLEVNIPLVDALWHALENGYYQLPLQSWDRTLLWRHLNPVLTDYKSHHISPKNIKEFAHLWHLTGRTSLRQPPEATSPEAHKLWLLVKRLDRELPQDKPSPPSH